MSYPNPCDSHDSITRFPLTSKMAVGIATQPENTLPAERDGNVQLKAWVIHGGHLDNDENNTGNNMAKIDASIAISTLDGFA